MSGEFAAYITAISTVILAIYAGIQVWLLRGQIRLMHDDLRESIMSREASVVLYVLQHMDNLRNKWHELYNLPEDYKLWNDQQKKLADYVCVGLQQVAYLAETGLFDKRYLADNYGGTFVKCWQKLEGFVRDYRISCGEPPAIEKGAFQRRHLELFVKFAKEYMQKFSREDKNRE